MVQESASITVGFKKLKQSDLEKINKYLRASRTSVEAFVEDTLTKYLKSVEGSLEDVGDCPNCRLSSGRKTPLKGLPLLEAEKRGWVEVKSQETRHWAQKLDIYFTICLDCLWSGYPNKSQISIWQMP